MTKEEIIKELEAGKKVTHRYFSPDEFIYLKNDRIHCERNYDIHDEFWQLRSQDSWNEGWGLFE